MTREWSDGVKRNSVIGPVRKMDLRAVKRAAKFGDLERERLRQENESMRRELENMKRAKGVGV